MSVPQAIPQLTVQSVNYSAVSIAWSHVSCCNSSGELPTYLVTLDIYNNDFVTVDSITLSSDTTSYIFTDLEPNMYYVRIAAINSIGAGEMSRYKEVEVEKLISKLNATPVKNFIFFHYKRLLIIYEFEINC